MKQNRFTLALALALCAMLLVGCAQQPASAAPEQPSAVVPQAEPSSAPEAVAPKASTPAPSVPEDASSASPAKAPLSPPVYAADLTDGSYPIEVTSSSSMFRVVGARLSVKSGKMSAVLTLSGTAYAHLYMGTGEQALKAPADQLIPFRVDAEGKYTYEIPVEALNKELDCAAFSTKKQTWYDRTLVFLADSLPTDPAAPAAAAAAPLKDGSYSAAVALSGGSGRASITSPAPLSIKNGAMTATITWSSPSYDYMLVNGEKYLPVNSTGNAVFEIPVSALDCDLTVIADTTAMSTPHEVEYLLRFDAASLQPEK